MGKINDDEIRTRNNISDFIRDAMPDTWLDHALELKHSAEIIWKTNDGSIRLLMSKELAQDLEDIRHTKKEFLSISRPYILLAGFALENLIKGLLVFQNPSHITSGKLSKELKSHKIVKLIKKIDGMELDDTEERFCQIVQDAIPYWGRYPIPLEYNDIMPEIGIDVELREAFLRLFSRMSKNLFEGIRDGWDSGAGSKIDFYFHDTFE